MKTTKLDARPEDYKTENYEDESFQKPGKYLRFLFL